MTSVIDVAELERTQNRGADIALLRSALAIESITGNETRFARFLCREMEQLGLKTGSGEFLEGRENVWGEIRGGDSGKHLMIIGHTDTVHVRGWEEYWGDDKRSNPFGGEEVNGNIWSRGACDLKGGICTAIAALRLIAEAGYVPEGKITLAFVGDEESGEEGTGISAGIKDFQKRINDGEIDRPDFAIYVEPTKLSVYTAQIGFFIADISITGKSAYFSKQELGVDALKAAQQILSQLRKHEENLRSGEKHDLLGPSSLLVTHISGGGYIAVPGECSISVIRILRPGESLDDATAGFETAVRDADFDKRCSITVDYPAGRDHPRGGTPVEIDQNHPDVLLLRKCISKAGKGYGAAGGAPYWSELPYLINQIQCPAVYCAPGDISVAHTFEERIDIEEYLSAIRGFALFIANYCGIKPRKSKGAH